MTLGGLALAIGILVDMSTVVVENVHTHLAGGKRIARAVVDSGREVALPLAIAMLCVLAVFVPAFFMVGAARAMFLPLSLAVAFAMVASYLLSSTLVPILTVWLLHGREPRAGESHAETGFAAARPAYAAFAGGAVRLRWLVASAYLTACAAVIGLLSGQLGTEIFPEVEAGQLQVRRRAPTGTRVDGTEEVALQVLGIIEDEVGAENIAITLGFLGVHAPSYPFNAAQCRCRNRYGRAQGAAARNLRGALARRELFLRAERPRREYR